MHMEMQNKLANAHTIYPSKRLLDIFNGIHVHLRGIFCYPIHTHTYVHFDYTLGYL